MVEDGEGNSPRGGAASLRPLKTIYGHLTEEAVLLNPALAATEATLYGFTISDSTTRSST
jgi:hypothetical protein